MNSPLSPLALTALSVGFLHTLLGPDHYVPFVAMSRVGKWSFPKTIVITLLCGVAHVGSSAVLGLFGVGIGVAVFKLNSIEAVRGSIAGWLLLAFGIAYFFWGIRRAIRNRPHTHLHVHADGTVHSHEHVHHGEHLHIHAMDNAAASNPSNASAMTPWVLFTIFLFGPCEPLIPLVMYPAARGAFGDVVLVTVLFGAVTLVTMLSLVVALRTSIEAVRLNRLERFSHAAAGLAIVACGVAATCGL